MVLRKRENIGNLMRKQYRELFGKLALVEVKDFSCDRLRNE
jgi:hypothetical protein